MAEKKSDQEQPKVSKIQPTYAELRAWCATVRHGNFSRAAKHLCLKQSSVQLLVRSLSEKVGRILGPDARLYTYDAAARSIRPTDEIGIKLYNYTDAAVGDIDRVEEFIKSLHIEEKSLWVSANLTLWEHRLLKVIGQIHAEEPGLFVRMYARGGKDSLELLRSHRCHVAFVGEFFEDEGFDGELTPIKKMFTPRFKSGLYKTVEVKLFLPSNSPLVFDDVFQDHLRHAKKGDKQSRKKVLQAIRDARSLILPGPWSMFRQQLEDIFWKYGLNIETEDIQEFDVGRCIFAAVAAGLGITIQQALAVDPALEPALIQIPLKGIIPDWRVIGVWDPLYMTEPARELVRRICKVEP